MTQGQKMTQYPVSRLGQTGEETRAAYPKWCIPLPQMVHSTTPNGAFHVNAYPKTQNLSLRRKIMLQTMYSSARDAVALGYDAVRCTYCSGWVWWNEAENPGIPPHHDHGTCLQKELSRRTETTSAPEPAA